MKGMLALMSSDVNDLLVELSEMCKLVHLSDRDTEAMFPPKHIATLVEKTRTADEDAMLDQWVSAQLQAWAKASFLMAALPAPDGWDVPLWMLEPWALPLQTKWAAGLQDAVEAAEKWLATT